MEIIKTLEDQEEEVKKVKKITKEIMNGEIEADQEVEEEKEIDIIVMITKEEVIGDQVAQVQGGKENQKKEKHVIETDRIVTMIGTVWIGNIALKG